MGVLQALECIKLIVRGVGNVPVLGRGEQEAEAPKPSLLIFSSTSISPFRSVRLRTRRPDCYACSMKAELSIENLESGSLDYVAFCGEVNPINLLDLEERVSAREYAACRAKADPHLLIDVREKIQFDICHLAGSVNIPFSKLQADEGFDIVEKDLKECEGPVFIICRLGNDSQISTRKLKEKFMLHNGVTREFKDIEGGLRAWKRDVDKNWPEY